MSIQWLIVIRIEKSSISSLLEKAREQNIIMSLNKSMMNLHLVYYAVLYAPLWKNNIIKEVKRKGRKTTKTIVGLLYHMWLNSTPQSMTTEWGYDGDIDPRMAMTYNNNYAATQLATNWSVLPYTAVLSSWALLKKNSL